MNIKLVPKFPKWEFNNIRKIWIYELVLAGLFLLLFLGWDIWIYQMKAEANSNLAALPDASKVIVLKKESLQAADKNIRAYKDFLKDPKFTF